MARDLVYLNGVELDVSAMIYWFVESSWWSRFGWEVCGGRIFAWCTPQHICAPLFNHYLRARRLTRNWVQEKLMREATKIQNLTSPTLLLKLLDILMR